ncbi:MAG: hypothetical protein IMY71_04995 [Bacteroidetes bacterium]|nr:hypothetical protein [Bacteroidota bacterium]
MIRNLIYFILIGFLVSCSYEFPVTDEELSSGNIDLTTYIAVGDNYSAGFMNGALYIGGQANSFPAILSGQFAMVGSNNDEFLQPLVSSENGYNPIVSEPAHCYGKWIYKFSNVTDEDPIRRLTPGELPDMFSGEKNKIRNFSVPLVKSFQIDRADLTDNIYYERFAVNPGTGTLLNDIISTNPSFFTLWLGMYDVLNFAMSGGSGEVDPPSDPDQIQEYDLTPADVFEESISEIIEGLLENPETKGVIANLPYISDLPFFYFRQYNFMRLSGSRLTQARSFTTPFNLAVIAHNMVPDNEMRPMIDFNDNGATLYPQPLVVVDESLCDAVYPDGSTLSKIRQLTEGELVLLTISEEEVNQGDLGSIIPVGQEFYLSENQLHELRIRINSYNHVINALADEYNGRIVVVDLNSIIHEISMTGKINAWGQISTQEQFDFNGVPLGARLGYNSIFSLDGLHFNPRGNTFVANRFIQRINDNFGSNIPLIDVNLFVGNTVEE